VGAFGMAIFFHDDSRNFNDVGVGANESKDLSLATHVTRVESSTVCCPNSVAIGFLFG